MDASNSRATSSTPGSRAVLISVRAMPAMMSRACTGTEAGQRSPRIAVDIFNRAAGSPPPALGQFRKRRGGFAIDHALDIVKRRIGFAVGIGPVRIASSVLAGVPAPDCQVQPAGKCDRPVNDDNLLVLGRTEGKDWS